MPDVDAGGIAVVDDDPAVLDSLKFLLEVLGCKVATYGSAQDFLDERAVRPACLIVDQHMPGMTGLELIQRLRDDSAAVPTLLITGSPSAAIAARAVELGVVAVLEKPPDETDLLKFVNAHS